MCVKVQLDFLKLINLFCFWLHWVFVAVRELFLDAGSDGYYPAVVQALLIAEASFWSTISKVHGLL